jgi:hypothetical protein
MYAEIFHISAPFANANDTWTAAIYTKDTPPVLVTGGIATGFGNQAGGNFTWYYDQFADGFYGYVRFVSSGGITRSAAVSPPPAGGAGGGGEENSYVGDEQVDIDDE